MFESFPDLDFCCKKAVPFVDNTKKSFPYNKKVRLHKSHNTQREVAIVL